MIDIGKIKNKKRSIILSIIILHLYMNIKKTFKKCKIKDK